MIVETPKLGVSTIIILSPGIFVETPKLGVSTC